LYEIEAVKKLISNPNAPITSCLPNQAKNFLILSRAGHGVAKSAPFYFFGF
jgi:hypothetical protein